MLNIISYLRKQCARYLRAAANRLDFPVNRPTSGHAKTDPFFDCLTRLKFSPSFIVDIGANRGGWTQTAMRYFPNARFALFEPQGELLAGGDLEKDPRVQIYQMGVGRESGIMKLSKSHRDDSFSFALSTEAALAAGREQIDAPVVALDEFIVEQNLKWPDIIKIDAEGWDLEVLKGAGKALAEAEVVLLEAGVMCKSFENRIEIVMEKLCKKGFILFDITDLNRTTNQNSLWLVELAFVRRGGKLDSAVRSYE